ncbi:MAG: vanW [Frankiales bacterium]|nr:vanW [Frankiales bacterium]
MRGRWVATVLAAVLTTTGTAAGTVAAVRSDEALPGTIVAGQDVGGQDRQALRATVEALARTRSTGELAVTAADTTAQVDRSLVTVDVDATVDRAVDAGRDGYPLSAVLGPLVGRGDEVDLVVTVDQAALRARLGTLATQVDRPAVEGGFAVSGTGVEPRQPAQGRTVDTTAALALVGDALRRGEAAVDVPVTVTPATTDAQDVRAVVAAATASLAGPYVVGTGTVSLRVTPQQVAPLLRAVPSDGQLLLRVDGPGLSVALAEQAQELEVGSREAGFEVLSTAPVLDGKGDLSWTPVPAEVRVRPGSSGREVDLDAATARFTELVLAAERDAPRALPLRVVEPDLTTAGAQAAGVRSLIGTFTTSFAAGAPRATNIRRIAQLVDGSYVAPGEVFSLNGAAGPRTLSRGFVADGAIVDGALTDEVGGGVSQFATTLFNAAFFAGLPIPEHKPHSFYISRYPAGRESTVYFGALDVKVGNDTGNGVLVRTRSTPGSVTVELYGDNGGRRVTSTSGPRRPRDDGGFRVTVTRSVTGGDGVSSRRVFSTSYDPVPPDPR